MKSHPAGLKNPKEHFNLNIISADENSSHALIYFNKYTAQRGIALIIVLWALTILMVTVLSFSYMTRTETYSALAFSKGIEKNFLAEAGIERGIMEIFYRKANLNKNIIAEAESEIWKTDGKPYKIQTDNGYYLVRITDESGKVDINTTPEVILRNLLSNLGLGLDEVNIIVDSMMDWKDPDDLHRLHGAENDYYLSLPNPYKARNAKFETLEELILVKGLTPEILYGNEEKRGIIDFLTVNSKTGGINLNAAPKEVLMALPGMSAETADFIINNRKTKDIKKEDIQGIVGKNYSIMSPYLYLTSAETDTFTIDAAGYKGDEKAGYNIRATVNIESNSKYKYVYYKSPVDIKHD